MAMTSIPPKSGQCPKCGRFIASKEWIVGKEGMILKVEHGDGSQPCMIVKPRER
jgi:hypothetical protein